MGWEFVAISADDAVDIRWRWRRIADDAALLVEESTDFPELGACIDDARKHGFLDVTEGLDEA